MFSRMTFASVAALSLILVSAMLVQAKRPKRIPDGAWGGAHIQLRVANGSASIEYDCANGKIEGPLKIDRRGRFDLRGTHVREHGGPTRIDENRDGAPARYTGWTDGKRMKLTVTLADSKTDVGTFDLTRGSDGRVFKCR